MTQAAQVIAADRTANVGVDDTKGVAQGLVDILADTYRLVFKTHAYHWNVEGPMFLSVHTLTEEQYNNLFDAADVLAERIRALGHLAPMSFSAMQDESVIKDQDDHLSAGDMCNDLAADHERLARRLDTLMTLADGKSDPVTEDLAVARSAFHQKAAWMLRALGKS